MNITFEEFSTLLTRNPGLTTNSEFAREWNNDVVSGETAYAYVVKENNETTMKFASFSNFKKIYHKYSDYRSVNSDHLVLQKDSYGNI